MARHDRPGGAGDGRGYDWRGLRAGMLAAISLPGLVMAFSFLGFGALVHSENFPLAAGLVSVPVIWALPGQVVFLDAWSHGLSLLLIALGVTLTAVRLLPMVVLVLSRARLEGAPRWPEYMAAHFIAATVWVMTEMHFDGLPRPARLPWVIGLGTALVAAMTLMTAAGYALTGLLPAPVSVTLVFFTPVFFLLALLDGARVPMDWLAIAAGAIIGPLTHLAWPGLDLLIAGIIGGSGAFALGLWWRRRP